jgi:hypothetical protein
MSDDAVFDSPEEPVMELVLTSGDEFTDVAPPTVEERRLRRHELRERFLPGVDAGAVFALGVSLVSLTSSGLIEMIAQNRELTFTMTGQFGLTNRDQLSPFRDMDHLKFLGQGIFAAVAVVVAVLVVGSWRAERHARWSRPVAQAALLIGLAGVVIALLGYFDVIATLPTYHSPTLQDSGSSS